MHKLAEFLAFGGIVVAALLRVPAIAHRWRASRCGRAARTAHECLRHYLGLALLGGICLAWLPCALLLDLILPRRRGAPLGRFAIMNGFRLYLALLTGLGAGRFDLSALDALRGAPPLIIAPNHPSLLDAVLIVSRLPNVVCIMKAGLMRNLFLGAGARLAGYIPNDSLRLMIASAAAALADGSHLLLFPEGTRTTQHPVNAFQGSIALIARRAGAPVQTVFIEADSAFLSKGWSLFRPAPQPIRYRIRLGRRFAHDTDALNAQLEAYFRDELSRPPPLSQVPSP
ncbi:lysophospholipid acyltransferase family protein [Paludibacterium yongneupense]|uniref:lysophospholipid acyltransferase family protein n=1 Tax=Paludibacterium yongneupense TaxID=400061 RepID=UPI000416C875|nr:lysophospholipid acyltransferase family protein [Paludibacterium yongneupense]